MKTVYLLSSMSILPCMVTYCTGSARQKRAYFEEVSGAIVLDNLEVLFCASENGKNYFAFGDVPFSGFTVSDYLKYSRAASKIEALADFFEGKATEFRTDIDRAIAKLGLSKNKKLGRLAPAEMRAVTFLEKTGGATDSALVVNLDGAKYSRRNAKALARLIKCAGGDVFVCVTDARFVEHSAPGCKTMAFGKKTDGVKPTFFAAKRLAKKIGAKKVAVM